MIIDNSPTLSHARIIWEYFEGFSFDLNEVSFSTDSISKYADTLIVCGSYDTRVMDKAVSVMEKFKSSTMVVSGHKGNWTSQFLDITECEYFFRSHLASIASVYAHQYLGESSEEITIRKELKAHLEGGLPDSIELEGLTILFEPKASNFGENIIFSRELLPDTDKACLFTKPNSSLRALLTAQAHCPSWDLKVCAPQISFPKDVSPIMGYIGIINELVGDVDRVLKYPSLNFMAEHTIPKDVLNSYHHLIEIGFTGHLLS